MTTSTKRRFSGTINFPEPVKTGATAMKRAEIDWTVHTEPIDRPGGERFIQSVRDDNGFLVGVNGRRHTVIQNESLAELGDTIIQMNAGFKYVGGGAFPNSDKTYLVLAGERTLNFGQADDNGFNAILLVNDFNGNSPLTATGFVGRLFCTNQISGLTRKGNQTLCRIAHTASSTWKLQAAKDTLRAAVHEMDETERELQRMLETPLTADAALQLAVGPPPIEVLNEEGIRANQRAFTTWETKRTSFRAELNAPWNEHLKGTALGAVMAAQGIDEHQSRSADREKARVDRLITANFPTMRKVLAAV
jgi:hypothetical protein